MSLSEFQKRSRDALQDERLQSCLANLKSGFVKKRRKAFKEIDFEALRTQGAAIRQKVIENMASLALEFEEQATKRGAKVYWANDANSANRLIKNICMQHDVRLLIKSKSMISEEVHVNHALEKSPIQVVETDLGEYIIQLRNEAPSHIIAPAFHLSRQDIAEAFLAHHHHLKPSRSLEKKEDLLLEAREILFQKFTQADASLTGANMLIAEDGSIALVTNEGNADICHSLPKVHIVLASIEKLTPRYQDAWTILRLLARSATGQRSSVFTSFVRADQRTHIILLDHGRSRWLDTPLQEALRCIRCGACMNHCPIYESIGGHAYHSVYPGPIGSIISPALFGLKSHGTMAGASSACGQCNDVCPVKIPITGIMRFWREQTFKENLTSWNSLSIRLWSWLTRNPLLYRLVIAMTRSTLYTLGLFSSSQTKSTPIIRLPFKNGWTRARDLPVPDRKRFFTLASLKTSLSSLFAFQKKPS